MKLGIIVVYMLKEENEPILNFHLKSIERYTSVPYTIYGSVNRLLPAFRYQLEKILRYRLTNFLPRDVGQGEGKSTQIIWNS
jgi:hypothetical protein